MDRLERDGIAESISLILRDPVHVLDELLIAIALFDLPPSEHSLLGGDHDVRWKRCELSEESSVVHKAWDVASDEAVHHAADPDNLAGEDAGVDGRLGIVSHDAPQELHPVETLPKLYSMFTDPYVFFKSLLQVPAPRLIQLPR